MFTRFRPVGSRCFQYAKVESRRSYTTAAPRRRGLQLVYLTIGGSAIAAGYLIGSNMIKLPYNYNYRPNTDIPSLVTSSPESPELASYTAKILSEANSLPVVQKLRSDPAYVESRAYEKMDREQRERLLTGGALLGPGRMAIKPLVFYNDDLKKLVLVFHAGQDLCGHRGLIHGGFLATMLDEVLGMCALQSLPESSGVTASLNVNYRTPTRANQFIVATAVVGNVEDSKVTIKGKLETATEPPTLLCDADGLFVFPKNYSLVKIRALF